MRKLWDRFLLLTLFLSAVGCATQSVSMKTHPVAPMGIDMGSRSNEYRLQVGDVIEIKFFGNPEYNETVMIRPDGKISLQLLDDVKVSGLTPMELDHLITEKYSEALRQPEVTVIVRGIGAKVFVGGEVQKPGFVPYDRPLTTLQAIFGAGGFAETAEPSSVILIRKNTEDKLTAMKIDLKKALKREPERDIVLLPSDILFVPKSNIADVNKFVKQYIRDVIPIPFGVSFENFFLGFGF